MPEQSIFFVQSLCDSRVSARVPDHSRHSKHAPTGRQTTNMVKQKYANPPMCCLLGSRL